MSLPTVDNPEGAMKRDERRGRAAVIGERVLAALGRPESPHLIRVHHLWADNYRVNVLLGESTAFATIAHSYFVSADSDGNILTATPAIRKQY